MQTAVCTWNGYRNVQTAVCIPSGAFETLTDMMDLFAK